MVKTIHLGWESGMNGRLNFRMRGPFRVTAPDGRDLTPRLAKAQGLLLLLLAGRDGARGRAWVQDRLWSDRAPEQGAASLRQALWAIRTEFGPYRDVLHADRSKVWLDMGRVSVDDEGSEDFAEGLDIRDPEFDEWLAGQRARTSEDAPDAGTRPAPPALTMGRPATAGPGADPERIGITCLSDGSEVAKWTAGYVGDSSAEVEDQATEAARRALGDRAFDEAVRQGHARDVATATRLAIAAFDQIIGDRVAPSA